MAYLIRTNITNDKGHHGYFIGFMHKQRIFMWIEKGSEKIKGAFDFKSEQAAQAYINKFNFINCSVEASNEQ